MTRRSPGGGKPRPYILLLLALASPAFAQEAVDPDPAGDPAVVSAIRSAQKTLSPVVVEIEALGGIPEAHKAPDTQAAAEQTGVLVKRGFKQAFGPSTGLILRADGLIATSTFILTRKPRHLIVTLADGRSFAAKLVGRDDSRALAILKIDAQGLPVPRFATTDELKVGRFAVAMGRGLATERPAVSLGIVSGLNRVGGRALQSSAAISPVNYGGPLVAIDGAVLGLLVPLSPQGATAGVGFYDSGIGFAIPAPALLKLSTRLAEGESLKAAYLGVALDDRHRGGGVRVARVAKGSPAEKAGLKEGHVIRSIGGKPVDVPWQLRHALGRVFAGESIELAVEWQGGEPTTLKVELGERPEQDPLGPHAPDGPKDER